jgi:hypothetical protein
MVQSKSIHTNKFSIAPCSSVLRATSVRIFVLKVRLIATVRLFCTSLLSQAPWQNRKSYHPCYFGIFSPQAPNTTCLPLPGTPIMCAVISNCCLPKFPVNHCPRSYYYYISPFRTRLSEDAMCHTFSDRSAAKNAHWQVFNCE